MKQEPAEEEEVAPLFQSRRGGTSLQFGGRWLLTPVKK